MLKPFNLGLGGRLGNGRQWMPWIYLDDLVRLILFLRDHETIHGPVNATSPNPCTNAEFTSVLGRSIRRPTIFPLPASLLRIVLGQFSEVLLSSQRVVPEIASRSGFEFGHPTLDGALAAALNQ